MRERPRVAGDSSGAAGDGSGIAGAGSGIAGAGSGTAGDSSGAAGDGSGIAGAGSGTADAGASATGQTPAAAGVVRRGLLGLGSNVGDRRASLQAAVDALPRVGVEPVACSSAYDTDPVGEVLDQPSFLNACLLVQTALPPLSLLDALKRLERELGRARGAPRHGPRAIDIDILMLGELERSDERLRLPHEQVLCRRFVLVPALELDAKIRTPAGESLADALARLPLSEGVRWAAPPLRLAARGPASG